MTYREAIKSGFRLINRNWQLVLVQVVMMIASCIGFFLFIGIPLAIALIFFGIDLTEMTRLRDFLGTMKEPSEIISRYLGLFLVLLASFLVYLLVILTIGLYVFCGSAGIIGRVVRDSSEKFSLNKFFSEGKRLFFPLLGFTAIIGLIFIAVAFILGIFGGGIAAIASIIKEYGATLALFIGIFFALLLFCVGLILIACTIALTLYGVASIIFKGTGPVKATKETAAYLYRNTNALWLYCIMFGGYILVSFILILIGTPFNLIPIVGAVIALPYQLISYTVQSYLGLVILSTTFIYYFSTEVKPFMPAATEAAPTAGGSTQATGTSQPQASEPAPPPQEKEGQG